MSTGVLATLVGIAAALVLAARSLRGRSLPPKRLAMMAAAWIVIIVGVVLLVRLVGLENA